MTGEQQRAAMRKDAFVDPSHMVDASNFGSFATNPMNWVRGIANLGIGGMNMATKATNEFGSGLGSGYKNMDTNPYFNMQPGLWFTDRNDDGSINTNPSMGDMNSDNAGISENQRYSLYERPKYSKAPSNLIFDSQAFKNNNFEANGMYNSELGDYYY